MTRYCPICNKAGLPNFEVVHVVCPQCNSDLRPFLILKGLELRSKQVSGSSKYILPSLIFTSILLGGLYSLSIVKNQNLSVTNKELGDSLTAMAKAVDARGISDINDSSGVKEIILRYQVKKGDYPYKIAEYFYGDGSKYKLIEAENSLTGPYILKVGQVLNIKIEQ